MSTLSDFLLAHPVAGMEKEVYLSPRLADHPFRIAAMDGDEVSGYLGICRLPQAGGGFDTQRFQMMVVVNHTLEPDFRDANLLERGGCQRPEDFVNKHLLAGEISALAREIAALSGYHQDFTALKAEVKN